MEDDEVSIGSDQMVTKRKALILGIIGSAIPLEERETATEKIGDPHSDANNMRRALIGDCSLLHSSLLQALLFIFYQIFICTAKRISQCSLMMVILIQYNQQKRIL
jgi:hypothetical protein